MLGVSERAGFVPVENFETEKVLNQFVAGMGDAGGRGKLANPPKYTIERVELRGTVFSLSRLRSSTRRASPAM